MTQDNASLAEDTRHRPPRCCSGPGAGACWHAPALPAVQDKREVRVWCAQRILAAGTIMLLVGACIHSRQRT
jgi:hypothetical protein